MQQQIELLQKKVDQLSVDAPRANTTLYALLALLAFMFACLALAKK